MKQTAPVAASVNKTLQQKPKLKEAIDNDVRNYLYKLPVAYVTSLVSDIIRTRSVRTTNK